MISYLKNKYVGDAAFYKHYIFLATPMIIQNAITNFVSFLDNIMVGQLGTEQMSGVAIVNQLIFVYNLAIFGAVSAGSIFGAQYFGKGDHEGQMHTFRFRLYATVLITLATITLFLTKGSFLINLYLTDASGTGATEVALKYALEYMAIIVVGFIPFAIDQTYVSVIKETGQTLIPMIAGFVAVISNALLDYLLIFGIGPFPMLGVEGAAIATVIARFLEFFVILIWAHSHRSDNRYLENAYSGFGLPGEILKQIVIKGFPLMLNEVMWAAAMTTITQNYSVRGLEVVAGLNISSTITNLFNIVFINLGACISIVVGQHLGAGELEEAKDADNKMIAFSVFCCTIMAILMLLTGSLFPRLYNTTDYIRGLATTFLYMSAIQMPLCALSHGSYFTLRSGGKTIITFMFDSVFSWVLLVPLSYCLTHFTGLDITIIYPIMLSTELIKDVLGFLLVRSNMWLNTMV